MNSFWFSLLIKVIINMYFLRDHGLWLIGVSWFRGASFIQTFRQSSAETSVWIRIPGLPVELYTETFLMKARAKLGTMLKIDQNTLFILRQICSHMCWDWSKEETSSCHYSVGWRIQSGVRGSSSNLLQMQSLRPLNGNLYEAGGYSNDGNGCCDD